MVIYSKNTLQKHKIGLIGFGKWARKNHVPTILQHAQSELRLVHDVDQRVQQALPTNVEFASSLDDFLKTDIDAVVIATPNETHASIAQKCIDRGLPVLLEKPLAETAAEGRDLVEKAKELGVQLMVPHGWNYWNAASKTRTGISEGVIGQLEVVNAHIIAPVRSSILSAHSGMGASPPSTQGFLYTQMTHLLALLLQVIRERFVEVQSYSQRFSSKSLEIGTTLSYRLENGGIGTASGVAISESSGKSNVSLDLYGDQGFIQIDSSCRRPLGNLGRLSDDWRGPAEDPVKRFLDSVAGIDVEDPAPPVDLVHVLECIEAAKRSEKSGRPEKILISQNMRNL